LNISSLTRTYFIEVPVSSQESQQSCMLGESTLTGQIYFPIYFIYNHVFSKHSLEVIPYLIFMKFSALNSEINIVSLYNFQIILFLLSLKN
jgi:hypothetical protein